MDNEMIKIHIISNPYGNDDTSFAINVDINGKETSVLELNLYQKLRIGSMLLKATRILIKSDELK